jgi:2-amino-4-hydroxy-6-hydroxymethyldihydropteridine diphosphokinase
MKAYLGLGTNLGDRKNNLLRAVEHINEQAGHVLACSSFIETEPWGFSSDNAFLNAVIEIDTSLTPHDLLHATQEIERAMGRTHKSLDGMYTDRIIDIDILLYEDLKISDTELTIPHPLIWQRSFVYGPLLEIAPQLKE